MKILKFNRTVPYFRNFELDALQAVVSVNGGFYPAGKLPAARVEAQNTIPGLVTTEGNIDVFFLLEAGDGGKYIEIVLQPIPGVFVSGGYVWPATEAGIANATITDRTYNGRAVIISDMDGTVIEFGYFSEYGGYYPLEEQVRIFALKHARQRAA